MRLFNCLYKVSRQSQATQAFKILSKSLFFFHSTDFKQVFNSSFISLEQKNATSQPTT